MLSIVSFSSPSNFSQSALSRASWRSERYRLRIYDSKFNYLSCEQASSGSTKFFTSQKYPAGVYYVLIDSGEGSYSEYDAYIKDYITFKWR